jgi:acyl-CoA synthetase (AMP-forming)/AMP-acid ligase II
MDSTARGIPLVEERLGALTLGGFLREVSANHADNEALVCHAPGRPVVRRTYAQVWAEAWNVARALVARGVGKETRVGLLCTNRAEWISAMFGIALSGGTCVLMSTFSKPAELEYQLRHADVSLLIFERSVLERDLAAELVAICPELANAGGEVQSRKLPFLRRAVCIGEATPAGSFEAWADFLREGPLAPESLMEGISAQIAPTDRGLVFFSSGSTGEPKGIVHAHRAAAIQCWRWRKIFAVDPKVRTWTANGFFWAGNFAMAVGTTFAAGGCLVLQRFFVPGEALRLMQAERVSLPLAWPHQWPQLVEDPAYREVDLSAMRYVGEGSPLRKHPTVRSDWQEPVAAYGSTETLTLSTVHPSGTDEAFARGNHGVPLPGNILRIIEPVVDPKTSELDPKAGRVMRRGEFGQIAIKGPTLMLGYLKKPVEDTFDDDGFFRSGDGGFIDEQGRLHWEGRLNDIVKTGGANVSPLEVDQIVAACPGVKLAATVGVPDDKLGELVVTCVVREASDAGKALDERQVRAFVSEQLSSYKVPRRVLFILERELELTATNKPKRGPLRTLAAKRLMEA